MQRQIRVLILEDSPADAELVAAELGRQGLETSWSRVDSQTAFETALDANPDVILSDCGLSAVDGLWALRLVRGRELAIPFILVTGAIGEEEAVRFMREGADDYILKGRLRRLGAAVEQALERYRLREQRRTAVQRIRFLNRLLETIREINRLMVREADRQRLLEATCRIVVELGPFQLAWVGEVDRESGRVIPVAVAGEDAGYLESVVIRHEGGPESAGPSGRSVREGQTAVVDDIATDAAFAPWRELALKRGFRSSISLPLRVAGEVVAALAVYSSEPRTFEGEIVDLLEELAGDLGFALEAIAVRRERERAAAALAESEQRHRMLAENANDLIWQTDLRGCFTYLSPAWERLTGFTVDESLGSGAADTLTPDSAQRIWAAIRELVALPAEERDQGVLLELQHVRRDGDIVDVEVSARVLVDEWGRPVAVQGISRNISERKRAEERFRTIFEAAPDACYLSDLNGVFLDGNQVAEEMTGYRREELIGKSFLDLDLLPDDELVKVADLLAASVRGEPTGPDELALRRKDGSEVEVEIRSHPVAIDGQTVVLGIARDITERKRTREALRESERRLSTLMRNLPGMAYRCRNDRDWTILFVSQGAHALTGYTAEELEGNARVAFSDLIHPEDRDRVWREVQAASNGPRHFVLEYRITDAHGDQKWVWEQGVEVEPGILEGLIVDISERRLAEEALRSSEERYRNVVELIGEGIAVTDNDQRFTFTNPAVCEIFGVPDGALVGRLATEFLDDENRSLVARETERRLEGERSVYEVTITRPDGERRQILLTATPQRDANGAVIGTFGICRDITESKSLEAQLRQAQKMEAVGRLAGGVAHDFNNLLQAFSGLTHGLRLQAGDPTAVDERIGELGNMIRRGSQLTRQLLLFSRRETYQPERLDLGEVVQGTQKLFRHLLRENIRLETRLAEALLPVEGDRGQLEQVLVNLAVNAQDAMPEGGRLIMSTAHDGGDWAILTVRDTGCGIPEEIQDKIFEPFFTTKEAEYGTGLGLAVVHGIISRAGGAITLDSETGTGTTFRIRLPLDRTLSSPAQAASAPTGEPAQGAGQTVLVVEDEEPVRRSICEMLEIVGYRAVGAESVAAVQSAVAGRRLDLVISDVVLPDGSGVQVIAGLRERQPDLPAIAISGYSTERGLLQQLQARTISFLQKPFDFEELAGEVRSLLRPAGAADEE